VPFDYPVTPARPDVGDDYHGELVADPYRWLEDTDAPETRAWIDAQNTLTSRWLDSVPTRGDIRRRMTELWDYPKHGAPFERGGQWFQWRQDGLANQPVLYAMPGPDADGTVLLDPNQLAADGTVAVTDAVASHDGTLLAYAASAAGSDWRTWRVRRVATGEDLPDELGWSKFTSLAWRHDGTGFYYGRLDPPVQGEQYLAANRLVRIVFHRLGDEQAADALVWSAPDEPDWLPEVQVSDDGRYLVLSISRGTGWENQVHVLDLAEPAAGPGPASEPAAAFRPLVGDFASIATVVGNDGDTFFLVTDHEAPRLRVVAASLAEPDRSAWRELVGEAEDTLLDARYYGGRFVCHRLHDAQSRLSVHDPAGGTPVDLQVPPGRYVGELTGRPGSALVHLATAGFTDSGSIYRHDLASGATTLVRAAGARVDPEAFVTEQVFVPSADGTRVPVFLVRRRDVEPTGDVATMLYGYGGFNHPMTPGFTVAHAVWVERGGLLAVACLRGGGEYGRPWHDAGRLAHKQNVFDDFCACARWLAGSGWTRPDRIGIIGRSNGGLLVGACLTQHPELFGAAVPEVGVLDMLRFHRFTIGWAWTSDYGNPDDPEQYRWIRAYSPLHNIRNAGTYPPTLLTTGDHDDRVVPGHSFKFAAALQAAQAGDAPVLIRIDTSAGHGMGKPTAKVIEERADVLAFLEQALGVAAERAGRGSG
jgi:prolyl oligopeptidase